MLGFPEPGYICFFHPMFNSVNEPQSSSTGDGYQLHWKGSVQMIIVYEYQQDVGMDRKVMLILFCQFSFFQVNNNVDGHKGRS